MYQIFINILKVIAMICTALTLGKLITKIKLPSILGWLITGMIFGPYLAGVVSLDIINSEWYKSAVNIFECFAGLMIGSEIIFKSLAKYGKQIMVITVAQSIGTFVFVSLVFVIAFLIANIPIYLAFIFGGIALATAPAPALSIVNEYKTKGPITRTLIPLAAMDDVIGVIVFFGVLAIVSATVIGTSVSILAIILSLLAPFAIGIAFGIATGFLLKRERKPLPTLLILIPFLLLSWGVGFTLNHFFFKGSPMNFLLLGMAFSTTFANIVGEERTKTIMKAFNPILGISLCVVIVNLGMPLDYRMILGAGVFTLIYILSRAGGKIGGAYLGAVITKSEPTVKKYLGLTLLPHSGVSLVFTGIAVGALIPVAPELAAIIQGTIAAAAIINEIIAVILAKQAFKWAGEIGKSDKILTSKNNDTLIENFEVETENNMTTTKNNDMVLVNPKEPTEINETIIE